MKEDKMRALAAVFLLLMVATGCGMSRTVVKDAAMATVKAAQVGQVQLTNCRTSEDPEVRDPACADVEKKLQAIEKLNQKLLEKAVTVRRTTPVTAQPSRAG